MTANSLAQRVADGFNQHGKFTARVVENDLAVEVRYVDDGVPATKVWTPAADGRGRWMWEAGGPDWASSARDLPGMAGVDQLVRAVAVSVLDERRTKPKTNPDDHWSLDEVAALLGAIAKRPGLSQAELTAIEKCHAAIGEALLTRYREALEAGA